MMPERKALKIGTRGSKLALWQARHVSELLRRIHPGLEVELEIIKTKGDELTDVKLTPALGRSFFVKEIEDALLAGTVDLAVHSLKDLGTTMPEGLILGAVPERASPHDCLVAMTPVTLETLPQGAKVATSSLRRKAQIRSARPDLELVDIRGNLDTRVGKLKAGGYDALVLAEAGLDRMGIEGVERCRIEAEVMMPAVGQGALGIQIRAADDELLERLRALEHPESRAAVDTERSFLRVLEGGCQVPAGALAVCRKKTIRVSAIVSDPEGRRMLRAEDKGSAAEAAALGERLARAMLEMGARSLMALSRATALILCVALLGLAGEARAQADVTQVKFGEKAIDVTSVILGESATIPLVAAAPGSSRGRLFQLPGPRAAGLNVSDLPENAHLGLLDPGGAVLAIGPAAELAKSLVSKPLTFRYILETPGSWFAQHAVGPGSKASFVARRTVVTHVVLGANKLEVECVADDESRSRGLMFRKEMPEEHGMLFIFQSEHRLSFWMKNTYLPLSIAFMDKEQVILNTRDMKPLDEGPRYTSRGKALYALEVNQGWFDRHGVKTGDKAEFLWSTVDATFVPGGTGP